MNMMFTGIEHDVKQSMTILKFLITQCGYMGEPNKLVYITWEDGEIIDIDSPDDRILDFIASSPIDIARFLNFTTMTKLVNFCKNMKG